MPEFQEWRLRTKQDSAHRILWIRGFPGAGKSTLAGYYVDLLGDLYPQAIVLYFFCVRGTTGLTKVRDIIRALAYQLSRADENAHCVFSNLKADGFELEDIGIPLLFDKLIGNLSIKDRDIYVILDGLDEADTQAKDTIDRLETAEIDIFLQSLAGLASTQLLLISRPDINISGILSPQNPTVKAIDIGDNREDIEIYVTNTLAKSTTLQNLFNRENVKPVRFFLDNANGIFLWVAVALQRLAMIDSRSDFQKELESMSEASGSMESLYLNILRGVPEKSRRWITEILRWVVGTRILLTVEELRASVERSLQDELGDFQKFVEVNCGSMLQILNAEDEEPNQIQLIHETFRSFLLSREKCPSDYYIDEAEISTYLVTKCLEVYLYPDAHNHYVAGLWTSYLDESTTSPHHVEELAPRLHRFLTSAGLKSWINNYIARISRPPSLYSHPSKGVIQILDYQNSFHACIMPLSWWIQAVLLSSISGSCDNGKYDVKTALDWFRSNVQDYTELCHYIGKVAGNMWVGACDDDFKCLRKGVFFLALRYHRRERGKFILSAELQALYENGFQALATGNSQISTRNIGMAYFLLQRWDDSLRCFEAVSDKPNTAFENWTYRGRAYHKKRDFEKAIQALKHAVQIDPKQSSGWVNIGKTYYKKGDYSLAIEALEKAIEIRKDDGRIWQKLGRAYMTIGDFQRILTYNDNPPLNLLHAELWPFIGLHYQMLDEYSKAMETILVAMETPGLYNEPNQYDFDGAAQRLGQHEAIQACKRAIAANPSSLWPVASLAKVYESNGNYDEAIRGLEAQLMKYPLKVDTEPIIRQLVHVYLRKGDSSKAKTIALEAIKKFPAQRWTLELLADYHEKLGELGAACRALKSGIERGLSMDYVLLCRLKNLLEIIGDEDMTIELFSQLMDAFPDSGMVRQHLSDAYTRKGDYDNAVQLWTRAIGRYGASSPGIAGEWYLWLELGKTYGRKGDLDKALDALTKSLEDLSDSDGEYDTYDTYSYICDICIRQGNFGRAIRLLDNAAMENPREEWHPLLASSIYKAQGDTNLAIKALQTAVSILEDDIRLDYSLQDSNVARLNRIRHQVHCDDCDQGPIQGYRYKCTGCAKFDLCISCMNKKPHPHPDNEFITIPSEKWMLENIGDLELPQVYTSGMLISIFSNCTEVGPSGGNEVEVA
jgi:tetratricopeptide (TPR) repeat protein